MSSQKTFCTLLNEYSQRSRDQQPPVYRDCGRVETSSPIVESSSGDVGSSSSSLYRIEASIDDLHAEAIAYSKKLARQEAARLLLLQLGIAKAATRKRVLLGMCR